MYDASQLCAWFARHERCHGENRYVVCAPNLSSLGTSIATQCVFLTLFLALPPQMVRSHGFGSSCARDLREEKGTARSFDVHIWHASIRGTNTLSYRSFPFDRRWPPAGAKFHEKRPPIFTLQGQSRLAVSRTASAQRRGVQSSERGTCGGMTCSVGCSTRFMFLQMLLFLGVEAYIVVLEERPPIPTPDVK